MAPPLLVRRDALLTVRTGEEEVKFLPHLGKGGNERSSTSLRDADRQWMGEPVRLLADAADVDKAYTLELGTSFKPRSVAIILRSSSAAGRAMRVGSFILLRLGIAAPVHTRPTATNV